MPSPGFRIKKPEYWNSKSFIRKVSKSRSQKRKKIGEKMYELLGCSCKGTDISISLLNTKDPTEFLKASNGIESEIFPEGFQKQEISKVARHIYERTKDKLNFGSYKELLNKYSTYDYKKDPGEPERYYYISRISGRFERAGVGNLNILDLQKFYCIIPEGSKEDAFNGFFRCSKNVNDMWGKDHMRRIGLGKIVLNYRKIITNEEIGQLGIQNWHKTKADNLKKKTHVFERLCFVGKPWIDAIYLGSNYLVEYIKNLPR